MMPLLPAVTGGIQELGANTCSFFVCAFGVSTREQIASSHVTKNHYGMWFKMRLNYYLFLLPHQLISKKLMMTYCIDL